jgi:hypothetical protein
MSRDNNNHESAGTPNHSKSRTRETLPPPPPPPPTQQEINSNVMNGQQDPILVHNSKQSPVNHINNIPEQVKMEPPPPPPPPPSGLIFIQYLTFYLIGFHFLFFTKEIFDF